MNRTLCSIIIAAITLGSFSNADARRLRPHTTYHRTTPHKTAHHERKHPSKRLSQAPSLSCETSTDEKSLTIYYPTNSWTISRPYLDCLKSFYGKHSEAQSWIVEGHADMRGSDDWNNTLGTNRAEGIEGYLERWGARGRITPVSYGAAKPVDSAHTPEAYRKNRRGIITVEGEIITEALKRLPEADAYILDASGSMRDFADDGRTSKWGVVTKYAYPAQSNRYAFNSCINVQSPSDLAAVQPDCGTPLWKSVLDVLNGQKQYKRITILTDGQDDNFNNPLLEQVILVAKAKGTHLSIAGVGVYSDAIRDQLARVANETGGEAYVRFERNKRR